MMGMDKMLSSMIGLSPDEMQGYVKNALDLLQNLNERFSRIETALGIEHIYSDENSASFTQSPLLKDIENIKTLLDLHVNDGKIENGQNSERIAIGDNTTD